MSGALPDWRYTLCRAGSTLTPIPFGVLLMTPVSAMKTLFYLLMMPNLVGLQLFLRSEQENMAQQVFGFLFLFFSSNFSPF